VTTSLTPAIPLSILSTDISLDIHYVVEAINTQLSEIADHARPLRLVPGKKKVDLAIDCTDLPYYGNPNTSGVVGGKPQRSTWWFFRFATICIVEEGYRLPLGVLPVDQFATSDLTGVVTELLRMASEHVGQLVDAGEEDKESERLLLDYLHKNPDSSRAWFGIGLNRTSTNNNEGAAEAYAEAVKINPAYHEVWNNMGNSIRRLGRLEEAANAFGEAVKIKEDYARAWIHLADVLVEMCRWEEAEKAALSAFSADPSVYGFDIIMKKIRERRYRIPG
jgi:tetratricopeptide (TPR) repeat protein